MRPLAPFKATAMLQAQYERFIAGGTTRTLATLTFTTLTTVLTVPVTHTEVVKNFKMMLGGESPETFVERCEFRSVLVQGIDGLLKKGLLCTLQVNPDLPTYAMMLWDGGLKEGGEVYRFSLVDANYRV